jgi:hypothetical protein
MAQGIDPNGLDPVGEWMFGWVGDAVPYLIAAVVVALIVKFIMSKLEDL